jgi:hypothetical protein
MRGVFNPWLRTAEGAVGLGGVTWLTVYVYRLGLSDPSASWARMDVRLAPIFAVLGLGAGYLIGQKRVALLRRIWPELEGRFFLWESDAFAKYGEASSFVRVQNWIYGWTFLATFFMPFYTGGRADAWVSPCVFVVGCFVAWSSSPLGTSSGCISPT